MNGETVGAIAVFKVAVLASGRGSNLASLLRHIEAGHVDAKVTFVASDKAGAGALDTARRHKVAAIAEVPREEGEAAAEYDQRLARLMTAARPDLVVLAGYMRIVGPAVIAAFPGRIVNVHPSLLPAFKGLRAQAQALAAGARIAGCSTHLVTGDLDGGPLLLQAAIPVRPDETEASLAGRILHLEHIVLPRTVQLFAAGRFDVSAKTGAARIAAGDSWLRRPGIDLVSGALYSEGF